MKINRNMSAVRANKQLLGTENRLSKSMKRLSSGYKINSAEDNPAGMAISRCAECHENSRRSTW